MRSWPSRPFTGAWIETPLENKRQRPESVAPSRGRGLKRLGEVLSIISAGRPFTGAWIKTISKPEMRPLKNRRPFTGAWIETRLFWISSPRCGVAPSRGRGLKLPSALLTDPDRLSPLHGGVD